MATLRMVDPFEVEAQKPPKQLTIRDRQVIRNILADAVNVYAQQALDARNKLETIKIAMIDNLLDLEEIFNFPNKLNEIVKNNQSNLSTVPGIEPMPMIQTDYFDYSGFPRFY